MLEHYANFYKDLYRKSDGYIPMWPFKTEVELGDLYVIRDGHMLKIGNILDKYFDIYEDVDIEEDWNVLWESWILQSGMKHSFISKDTVYEYGNYIFPLEKQGLLIQFEEEGSYYFEAQGMKQRSINNFYEFKFKLLQELTSEKFNFKEAYIVTSVAKAKDLTLMISGDKNASLMISIDNDIKLFQTENYLTSDNADWTVESMDNIAAIHIDNDGGQLFFKAQKLEASNQGKELIRKYMRHNLPKSMQQYAANILRFVPTQILPSNEIYPTKAHELFHFREMNLNDISMFFSE